MAAFFIICLHKVLVFDKDLWLSWFCSSTFFELSYCGGGVLIKSLVKILNNIRTERKAGILIYAWR